MLAVGVMSTVATPAFQSRGGGADFFGAAAGRLAVHRTRASQARERGIRMPDGEGKRTGQSNGGMRWWWYVSKMDATLPLGAPGSSPASGRTDAGYAEVKQYR
jgi:hypothetical protein